MITLDITPNEKIELNAGAMQALKAVATGKSGPIESINWSVVNTSGQNMLNPPTVVDAKCTTLNRTGAAINGSPSQATCNTMLTVPNNITSSMWKIEATAIGPQNSKVVKSFDLRINSAPLASTGFKVIVPEKPIKFEEGKIASLTANVMSNEGVSVENIKYNWSLLGEIRREGVPPTNPTLVGADTPTVSFVTSVDTTYYLKVTANANVNGQSTSTSATVVGYTSGMSNPGGTNPGGTNPPLIDFSLDAGLPQIGNLGTLVTLKANTNIPGALFQWTQKSGPLVALSLTVGAETTFIPILPGVYNFEVMATVDGITKIANTSVTVNDFNILLTAPQIATLGAKVDLKASVIGDVLPVVYEWYRISGHLNLSITNSTTENSSFIAAEAGIYQIGLRATVGTGASAVTKEYSTLIVVNPFNILLDNVLNVSVGTNPIALAANLDISTDKAIYEWVQVSGDPVQLLNADTAQVSFLPTPDNKEYEFMLTVTVGNVVKTVKTKVISLLK